MKMWIFFLCLSMVTALVPTMVFAKKTVCTITLNSDNEKKLFQSKFKGEDIQFTELTKFKKGLKDENDWFAKACESGVQCDSLVISGHFGGTFFGEKNPLTLPLTELDKQSCSRSCKGILNSPSEVYLFGCNTLADKGKDTRTPAEYRRILIEDGISEENADRIVASRYSPIGQSFKASMQKIFSGVPQIYGFDSVGPSGKNVAPKLNNYLSKIPNYSDRLDELMAMKVMAQIKKSNDVGNRFAAPWTESMTGTAFASCAGKIGDDRKECGLFDSKKSLQEKLLLAENLMNGANRRNYFLSVEEFLKDKDTSKFSEEEMAILRRIGAQKEAALEFKKAMPQLTATPELKFQMLTLGEKLGWLDRDFSVSQYESQLASAARTGFTGDAASALCTIAKPPDLKPSAIKSEWFRNPGFITIVGCWQNTTGGKLTPYAVGELNKQLSGGDSEIVVSVMSMISKAGPMEPETQVRIAEHLYNKDSGVVAAAMTTLAGIKNPDARVVQIVARGLQSSDPAERKRAAFTVRNMQLQDPGLKRQALQIAPEMQPW